MIDVSRCPCCGWWQVTLMDRYQIVKTTEEGIARRMARILSDARNRQPREAMRLLCDEVGYAEDSAKAILHALHGGTPDGGLPN
jgi:hypothetical protein